MEVVVVIPVGCNRGVGVGPVDIEAQPGRVLVREIQRRHSGGSRKAAGRFEGVHRIHTVLG